MQSAYEAVNHLLEHKLPGQDFRLSVGQDVRISIAFPVLTETPMLRTRREEWDETLRTIVSVSAETGNQIIGHWIDRAARGEMEATEVPVAVEALRAICQRSGEDGPARPVKTLALGYS